ncbi:helix-turn-helix transcriptional regulator [Geodermatophilus sp. CPCC 206100]|uniref:helix-turn-helix transcriptional regulator n=1 Tax=Geodermatophilus sp. CPCC 206100 TaxID=3020054 RepID=UPI003AFFA5A5
MNSRKDLREFLATRRARITPQQAGLPTYGGHRRVPGLRREEVALLAGVSVEYYTRLERGNANGVSDGVLEALVRVLQLDDAERAHLYDLTRGMTTAARTRRRPARPGVRPGVQQLLDAMADVPALVQNGRLDVPAANPLARALYADLFDDAAPGSAGRTPNHARYAFLDPRATDFYPDWNRVAADIVSQLRAEVGRSPDDRELTELIGELTTRSQPFSTLWATHNVRWHTTGTKRFHHRVVGDLSLSYEGLALAADPGQTLITFTAEPGSPSQQALTFLASWATSPAQRSLTRTGRRATTRPDRSGEGPQRSVGSASD